MRKGKRERLAARRENAERMAVKARSERVPELEGKFVSSCKRLVLHLPVGRSRPAWDFNAKNSKLLTGKPRLYR
jgi:hypothetical protein